MFLSSRAGVVGLVLLASLVISFVVSTGLRRPSPREASALSVAVLPFENMSADQSLNTLTGGLTRELGAALARVQAFTLVSDTSLPDAAKPGDFSGLNVRYVVSGGLQRIGERTRFNIQLTDVMAGRNVWAENYESVDEDLLQVQDNLVAQAARELRLQIYRSARAELLSKDLSKANAAELYLVATFSRADVANTLEWQHQRLSLARRAIELDPEFGPAHSVLADVLMYLAAFDPPSDTPQAHQEAVRHARLSLNYAALDADTHFNLMAHHFHSGRMGEAVRAARRAVELDPNHPVAEMFQHRLLHQCAPAPQPVLDRILAFDASLSPDNPARWLPQIWLASLYLNRGEYELSAKAGRQAMLLFPTIQSAYILAAALVQLDEHEDAVAVLLQQREAWPNMDPRHFAEHSTARYCREAVGGEATQSVFRDLAEAYEQAVADGR